MTKPLTEMTTSELLARDAEIGNKLDDYKRADPSRPCDPFCSACESERNLLRERREVRAILEQKHLASFTDSTADAPRELFEWYDNAS